MGCDPSVQIQKARRPNDKLIVVEVGLYSAGMVPPVVAHGENLSHY